MGAEFRPSEMSPEQKHAKARDRLENPSAPEALLWSYLKLAQLAGFDFAREKEIDGWYVDLYCAAARLVVEIDGKHHIQQRREDNRRDEIMRANHYRVMRFTASQVMKDVDAVVARIRKAVDTPWARNRHDQLAKHALAGTRRKTNSSKSEIKEDPPAVRRQQALRPRKGRYKCLRCERQFVADVDAPVECRRCHVKPQPICSKCKALGPWVSLDRRICRSCADINDVARSLAGSGETPQGPLHKRRGRAKKIP